MTAPKKTHRARSSPRDPRKEGDEIAGLRIIGGRWRGHRLGYTGDPRTRPMKDRVRQAIFDLLAGSIRGKHAVDLFAGTGALGLEALSRGAAQATFIEQHFPTVAMLRENIDSLGVSSACKVFPANTFVQFRRGLELGAGPWAVFCSPPYDFYVHRREEMLGLLRGLLAAAPAQSLMVVEADQRFDFGLLPSPEAWDVRVYAPAMVGIYEKPATE